MLLGVVKAVKLVPVVGRSSYSFRSLIAEVTYMRLVREPIASFTNSAF